MLDSKRNIKVKIHPLRHRIFFFLFIASLCLKLNGQVKLHLDSSLVAHYKKVNKHNNNRLLIPFYCDPFYEHLYKKTDTVKLCGKYVFVDSSMNLKIKPSFELPCWFNPYFQDNLCAVSVQNEIVYIDTLGNIKIRTGLSACSNNKNKAFPFKNNKARLVKGSNTLKKYFTAIYIDTLGNSIKPQIAIKVKPKPVLIVSNPKKNVVPVEIKPDIVTVETNIPKLDFSFIPKKSPKLKYFIPEVEAQIIKEKNKGKDLFLIQYQCGSYQIENMNLEDTVFCNKYVFVDSNFNVRIAKNFEIPCAFEPEFSEGLCAVGFDSVIVYIDTFGQIRIKTDLKACDPSYNKASTFKNGIATLYKGDPKLKGYYQTIAINTAGERVRLLEFDELELAELKWQLFKNIELSETSQCFIGKGKTNGIWFLIEKSGKIRKKLELK
jgi:hypothetical protein